MDILPNQTLYVNNLNDKVSQNVDFRLDVVVFEAILKISLIISLKMLWRFFLSYKVTYL